MRVFILIAAVVFLALSFFVPKFYLQFLVLGAIMLCYFFSHRTSGEIEEMKEIINRHNELVKEGGRGYLELRRGFFMLDRPAFSCYSVFRKCFCNDEGGLSLEDTPYLRYTPEKP